MGFRQALNRLEIPHHHHHHHHHHQWVIRGCLPCCRSLMKYGQKAAEAVRRPSEQATRGIIAAAQKTTGSLPGTATACVAQLGPQATLHVANVGDSCLVVFRRGECIFASEVLPCA